MLVQKMKTFRMSTDLFDTLEWAKWQKNIELIIGKINFSERNESLKKIWFSNLIYYIMSTIALPWILNSEMTIEESLCCKNEGFKK